MKPERIKALLVALNFDPATITLDKDSLTLNNEIRVDFSDFGTACVSYEVEATVDFPCCDTEGDLIADVMRATDHIFVYQKVLAKHGGKLPIGWCY